jgi:glucose 1-dehydrogenase
MKGLEGKVAVVTGGGRGIGRAIAVRFAREGADVVVNYAHNAAEANDARAQVEAAGRRGLVIQANLGSAAEARRLVEDSARQMGRLDILVNNAGGGGQAKPFTEVAEEDYDRVVDLNLKGVFFASQAFARHLIAAGRPGRIINISSVHEEIPLPGEAAYCAAKGGVKLLTRDLAVELARHGITVNVVAPGAIDTPANAALVRDRPRLEALLRQIPLGRLGTSEDVAGVTAFLASDDAAYVTGSSYFVDGGLTWYYEE